MNKYSAERASGREHVPLYPRGFIALRIVQLVIGVIIVGLCGFGVAGAAFDGDVLTLFTALATLITCIYLLVAEYRAPALYNYWAVLEVSYLYNYGLNYRYYDSYYFSGATRAWLACLATAAGLGAAQFALFITSLTIHGVMLHRHRMAGLHCNPGSVGNPPSENQVTLSVQNHAQIYQPDPRKVSQVYVAQNTGFAPPQQAFDPARRATTIFPNQPIYAPSVTQPQLQPYSPRQTVTPLSAQHTGDTFNQIPLQELTPPMPTNTYEVLIASRRTLTRFLIASRLILTRFPTTSRLLLTRCPVASPITTSATASRA